MNNLKYVIIDELYPLIFPSAVTHADAAAGARRSIRQIAGPGVATSAGFCQIGITGEVVCYGESVSLQIKSNPENDAMVIKSTLFSVI